MTIDALLSSESVEWFTPAYIIKAAREVLQTIDLDPASCEQANKIVQATRYYSKEDNGLMYPWHGNIWLNCPYGRTSGKSNQALWSQRLIGQYEQGITSQAILLVNAATSERWFQPLWRYLICFPEGRVRFSTPRGASDSPTHGSALVYFGEQRKRFYEVFSQFGPIVKAVTMPALLAVNAELF